LDINLKGHTWQERLLAMGPNLEVDFSSQFIVHSVHSGIVTPLKLAEHGKRTLYRCGLALDPNDDTLLTK
jgi:hypothetical protein